MRNAVLTAPLILTSRPPRLATTSEQAAHGHSHCIKGLFGPSPLSEDGSYFSRLKSCANTVDRGIFVCPIMSCNIIQHTLIVSHKVAVYLSKLRRLCAPFLRAQVVEASIQNLHLDCHYFA